MGIALRQLDTYVPPLNVTSSHLFHSQPTELLKNLTTRRDNDDKRNSGSNKTLLWTGGLCSARRRFIYSFHKAAGMFDRPSPGQ